MDELNRPKVLAIDLDGTVLEQRPFPDLGPPLPGIAEELEALQQAGWKIAIWTCRDESFYDQIQQFLTDNGVPFDYINENPFESPSTSPKIYADVYVDDRGMQFEGEARGLAARVLSHRPWHKRSPWGQEEE
jgi:hypothetical protein